MQLDAIIEQQKNEAIVRLHTAGLRMAMEVGADPSRFASATVQKGFPLIAARIDEEAEKIRRQIKPTLDVVN